MAAATTKTTMESPPLLPSINARPPPRLPIHGQHVLLRPLSPSDTEGLFTTLGGTDNAQVWAFIPDGPYLTAASLEAALTAKSQSADPIFFTVVQPQTNTPVGYVSFLRIDVPNRVVEIGHLVFSSQVHRSTLTTETIYLMLKLAFDDLNFRRVEWKCNGRNEPSKAAARRFGFVFEGLFRQHMIVKGRNRDTAWFSVVDGEWEGVKRGFELWLRSENFDEDGRQKRRLEECRSIGSERSG